MFPGDFDQGSYDVCSSNLTFEISKSIFTCEDLGPNSVTFTVTDEAGNSDFAIITVNVADKNNISQALACNDNIIIPVLPNLPTLFTSDMMLEGGPYNCYSYYEAKIYENGLPRSNNYFYFTDIGKNLTGKITDPVSNNSCWGTITVVSDECANSFTICDTKSKCEPLGDCNSGHSDTDNVEWPCNIDAYVPLNVYKNPSPEALALYLQVSVNDMKPELIWANTDCNSISMAYSDLELKISNSNKKILRKWTILNWLTGEYYIYTHIIILNSIAGECDVCDTLAWNTPIGDCASGHTLSDAVEWPADITVNGSASIAALEANPLVNPNDVKPQLNNACTLGLTFNDTYLENGNEVIITRKWEVTNWNTLNNSIFIQTITVINVDENNRTVCVKRKDGSNIDNVKLYEGNVLESGGCKTFAYDTNNKIITPSKEDNDLTTDIDLADLILLQEFILGITKPDAIQTLAADLNGNGFISTIDAFLLTKIILGDTSILNNFGSPWRFANVSSLLNENEQINLPNSADISKAFYSAHFVGFRLGDVSEDFTSNTSLPITTVILEDEILNKDEVYEIPVIAKQDYRVKGLQFNIDKSDGIEFLNVGGDYFDNFTVLEYPTHYVVSWVPEASEALKDGLPVFSGTAMFTLKFRATKNNIMSNSIQFGNDNNNRLIAPIHLPTYQLKFGFDNLIPVGTKNIVDKKLSISPSVVDDQFKMTFNDEIATLKMYNLEGKILKSENVISGTVVDITTFQSGLYFVTVLYSDGKKDVKKIVKL